MIKINNKYKISICIPTYNRSDFLIEGLKTWMKIPEYKDLEFVVADDASSDDTVEKVKKFQKDNPQVKIVFKSFKKRMYFDKMVLEIVKMAHGKFCWLISDDDLPRKDSVSKIFKIIQNHPDLSLIHLNYSRYDNILKKVTSRKMVGDIDRDIYFTNVDKFYFREISKSYFKFLGTNVITMSTDIVNREKWLHATKGIEKYVKHNFIHCFVILKMIYQSPKIYYVASPVVQYLSNNHRVWPNDIWKDYNNVLLGFLHDLGYDQELIHKMQISQKQFETREGIMKHPILQYGYKLARPLYSTLQNLYNRING